MKKLNEDYGAYSASAEEIIKYLKNQVDTELPSQKQNIQ